MPFDKLGYPLNNNELEDLLSDRDSLFNADEISVGTNDIIDRRSYIPGDKEIINEVADKLGLSD
ncbi:hypothetical protein [Halanaerobacter jeridensis]|uniref:Uncharacterized protein n=1 Tax=Halanaerobacter jeridensis TaxID=706427 RepID=A0A938XSM0_9FIRM|nr:hypothetical protein [Halanaerobacter jeridensis]MBM7556750.1 hypothetical protein [Halanaerobacter jeridensis]